MKMKAKKGARVTVSYVGTLDNGRIFDTTEDNPLTITLGAEEIFPALEEQIVGMKVGDVKNIFLHTRDAYGPRQPENILTVSKDIFPADKEIKVGQKLSLTFGPAGEKVMQIIDHNETEVVLDGNHPLAGCDLTFALRLDEIV